MSALPPAAAASVPVGLRSRAADYLSLTKPRVTFLVLVTTALGYLLAASAVEPWILFHTIAGTAMVAGAAAALNQVWERDADAKMRRTARRAIPSGRLEPSAALVFAFTMAIAGLVELAAGAGILAAGLGALSLGLYVLVYTPLKRRTSLATIVGAVPGAIPPMIGWAAATGRLDPGGWVLFLVLFFWQMPHFLAIAWLYREDYARGGFPMLPVVEPDGASTGRQAALYAATLVPISLSLTSLRVTGGIYFVGAAVCGLAFTAAAAGFALRRETSRARVLFAASILYLPALLTLAFLDRVAG